MHLTKDQRARLYNNELVELTKPATENPPFAPGRSYRIDGTQARTLVLRQRRTPEGWTAVLTLDRQDRPRLLSKGLGYTEYPPQGLPEEPEAVREDIQLQFTKDARECFQAARRGELAERVATVLLPKQ